MRCLHKIPRHRPASAAAVHDDLCRYLEGRPITICPLGRGGRLAEWCYARPAAAVICALTLLLFITAVFFSFTTRNAQRGRERAEDDLAAAEAAIRNADEINTRRLFNEFENNSQDFFNTLELNRYTKNQSHPPEVPEPGVQALEARLRKLDQSLKSSPWPDKARPWRDLCAA